MSADKKIVAVCTSRIFDAQQHSFLKQLGEELSKHDTVMLIFCTNTDLYWNEDKYQPEAVVFDTVPFETVDLLVIMDEKIKSRNVSNSLISRAERHGVPVIVVDGHYDGTVEIRFDYGRGFESVVRHIIEHHKVKKPHFIAGIKDNPFSEERIGIFKKVLADNGIPFSPQMVSYGEFWAAPARNAIKNVIASGNIPDAVICANDIMAINVQDVLIKSGYRVPDDVIVSGFDGIDESNLCSPRLTTAVCGSDLLASKVSECIFSCFEEKFPEKVFVEPVLVTSGSCGCRSDAESAMSALNRFNDGFYRYQDDIRVMYEISTAMQMSSTPCGAAHCLEDPMMHDIHCFVFSSCLETEPDYFSAPLLESEKNKITLFYDSYETGIDIRKVDPALIKDFIIGSVRSGCPMIINALDYLGKPMGYICYTFGSYDFIEYAKTASVTNTVSMGLGGFICAQYQRYLSKKVEEMYTRDPLTGLYNRSGFNSEFERLRGLGELHGKTATIIMADLDGLKYINDTFGHEAGDNAIAAAAGALKSCCPDDSLCVRFGGDEMFALILGECDPEKIIASIDRELERINTLHDESYVIAMSCGAYSSVLDGHFELGSAVKLADEKMYCNKRNRKNKYNCLPN